MERETRFAYTCNVGVYTAGIRSRWGSIIATIDELKMSGIFHQEIEHNMAWLLCPESPSFFGVLASIPAAISSAFYASVCKQ